MAEKKYTPMMQHYLKMKEEEGEAFADAVFFGVNK